METVTKDVKQTVESRLSQVKAGSKRSLALIVTSIMVADGVSKPEASEKAWQFAESVYDRHGNEFTAEDALLDYQLLNNASAPKAAKPKSEPKLPKNDDMVLSDADAKIMNDQSATKNSRIRFAIEQGKSLTSIAKFFGINYQQVKNVKKKMDDVHIVNLLVSGEKEQEIRKNASWANISPARMTRLKELAAQRK